MKYQDIEIYGGMEVSLHTTPASTIVTMFKPWLIYPGGGATRASTRPGFPHDPTISGNGTAMLSASCTVRNDSELQSSTFKLYSMLLPHTTESSAVVLQLRQSASRGFMSGYIKLRGKSFLITEGLALRALELALIRRSITAPQSISRLTAEPETVPVFQ
jgi:hypothetical protein